MILTEEEFEAIEGQETSSPLDITPEGSLPDEVESVKEPESEDTSKAPSEGDFYRSNQEDQRHKIPAETSDSEEIPGIFQKEVQKKQKKKHLYLINLLNGNLLRPLLRKRYIYVGLLVALCFFANIYMGFLRIDKINRIDRLEERLRQIEYRQLFVTGEISKIDKEETVLQILKQNGSSLVPDEDPPYIILYNGEDFRKQQRNSKKE